MALLFVDIPIENFTDFLKLNYPKHNNNTQYDYHLHTWNSFQKNFANEILESYYGLHYLGICPQNNSNYRFEVVNKKLYTIAKLKFNI